MVRKSQRKSLLRPERVLVKSTLSLSLFVWLLLSAGACVVILLVCYLRDGQPRLCLRVGTAHKKRNRNGNKNKNENENENKSKTIHRQIMRLSVLRKKPAAAQIESDTTIEKLVCSFRTCAQPQAPASSDPAARPKLSEPSPPPPPPPREPSLPVPAKQKQKQKQKPNPNLNMP
jgi:hypothetical protein